MPVGRISFSSQTHGNEVVGIRRTTTHRPKIKLRRAAISGSACTRSGTTVEVPAEAAGARLRPRSRARRRVRLDLIRPGSTPGCRPGPAARDAGFARSPPRCEPEPGAGQPQRPALRRPTPDPERPAPPARSDRARAQPVPGTVATCRNTVALLREAPAPDHRRSPLPGLSTCVYRPSHHGAVSSVRTTQRPWNMRSLRRVG